MRALSTVLYIVYITSQVEALHSTIYEVFPCLYLYYNKLGSVLFYTEMFITPKVR
jgi:hypothetical protein